MLSPTSIVALAVLALAGAAGAAKDGQVTSSNDIVLRIRSSTPGHEIRVRGVLLVSGQPMQVVEQTTPFEFRSGRGLVFAAFEPVGSQAMLRLELISETPEPAVVTAPRVMVGQRIGGVASEFVQGY